MRGELVNIFTCFTEVSSLSSFFFFFLLHLPSSSSSSSFLFNVFFVFHISFPIDFPNFHVFEVVILGSFSFYCLAFFFVFQHVFYMCQCDFFTSFFFLFPLVVLCWFFFHFPFSIPSNFVFCPVSGVVPSALEHHVSLCCFLSRFSCPFIVFSFRLHDGFIVSVKTESMGFRKIILHMAFDRAGRPFLECCSLVWRDSQQWLCRVRRTSNSTRRRKTCSGSPAKHFLIRTLQTNRASKGADPLQQEPRGDWAADRCASFLEKTNYFIIMCARSSLCGVRCGPCP